MTVYCSLLHRRIISMKRKGIGRDRLPYTESPARFFFFQIPRTQKIGTRFSASADFVTLSCSLIFGVSGVNPLLHAPKIKDLCGF